MQKMNFNQTTTQAAASAASGGVPAASWCGLVSNKTSDTRTGFVSVNDRYVSLHREEQTELRVKRMRSSMIMASRLQETMQKGGFRLRPWFVTLTYRTPDQWQARHVSGFLKCVREWARRQGAKFRYVWVAELQERGALHYHLVIWLPKRLSLPKADNRGWWPHGMTNTQTVKQSVIGYLLKYISKASPLHNFPKNCRISGKGGLDAEMRKVASWANLPQWVKNSHGVGEVRRIRGALVSSAGEILGPMYRVIKTGAGLLLRCLGELPERQHEGPYSPWSAA